MSQFIHYKLFDNPFDLKIGFTLKSLLSTEMSSFSPAEIISEEQSQLNREALALDLGFTPQDAKMAKQIHSDIVLELSNYYGELRKQEADALISNNPKDLLMVSIADCAGILLYSPTHKVKAAIHSGWKGTQQNIVAKTIEKLELNYNINPSELYVYISPMAQVENYEVGKEFTEMFPHTTHFINGKYYYDNKSEIISQLKEAGINSKQLSIVNVCTMNNSFLHSFRRDKALSGRMAAFIG